jgi:hypothetical protein
MVQLNAPESNHKRLRESVGRGWKTDLAIMLVGDMSLVGGLILFAAVILGRLILVPRNRGLNIRRVV